MAENSKMHAFSSRLRTFQIAHQLSKRRASSQASSKKKGGGNTVEWPHAKPTPEDLARAGFFYQPSQDSPDNVQCFHCTVKLDGWEASDDALKEHLAHSASCHWAQSYSAGVAAQRSPPDEARDPMDEELVAARKATFEIGHGWPHENKRGWKCKITKMVEAGWCLDPAPSGDAEEGDGVTCFYCNLSLDGWEPKDDPFHEHKRRSEECAFFALLEKFGSGAEGGKKAKSKGRGKAAARDSTASKASRMSTQSVQSLISEASGLADGAAAEDMAVDDSIVSTASQATITGTTKGKKKGGRAKATATGTKGRKRAGTVDSQADAGPLYPEIDSHAHSQPAEENILSPPMQTEEAQAPGKKTRKAARQSKQPLDSSVVEVSSFDIVPSKKATRARNAKATPEPEPQVAEVVAELDNSEVSAQLQEELERSMDMETPMEDVVAAPAKAKRGTKRTSDGHKKQQEEDIGQDLVDYFPIPPKAAPAPKGRKGRKPSKQITEEIENEPPVETQDNLPVSESEAEPVKPTKSKKAPSKKGTRAKKASSARSSKATVTAEDDQIRDEPEDLERDEREIEAELERIAAEQAIQAEQDKMAEFEPSPSHAQRQESEMRHLEREVQAEKSVRKSVSYLAPRQPSLAAEQGKENATPSPSGSDKENQPSSQFQPSAKRPTAPTVILSPTKTIRIPLAPGTPNRLSPSKSRMLLLSPSKQFSHLTSAQPWEGVDLDTILLASPQPTPGTLAQRLAGAVGTLTSPEKGLTVEEWVRYQADKAERELKRRCEEQVQTFEREGMRGINCLDGIPVVG